MELCWKGPAPEAVSLSSKDIQPPLGSLTCVKAANRSGCASGSKDCCDGICTGSRGLTRAILICLQGRESVPVANGLLGLLCGLF
jgi:hypothetical protein